MDCFELPLSSAAWHLGQAEDGLPEPSGEQVQPLIPFRRQAALLDSELRELLRW